MKPNLPVSAVGLRRPIRLCAATRAFAKESLAAKYGDLAMQTRAVEMDAVPGFAQMTPEDQYDEMLAKVVREAPVRICPAERVSGAATLGLASEHFVPATFEGKNVLYAISHVTLGFDRALRVGVDEMEREVLEREARGGLDEAQARLLLSMRRSVDAMRVWHARYLEALKDARPEGYETLKRVPFAKPGNFREAVQALWFLFAFTRLAGNWSGIGRIDEMLGGYLHRDLESGAITLREAREWIASFFIKGCEWIRSDRTPSSGDAQHYQNIVLSGLDENERDVTNEVTYLVLDVVEELGISDFPIAVRVSERTPEKLFRKIARVARHGGGIVAVYGEDTVLSAMQGMGYSRKEALRFANDGCWEVQVPGKTRFNYVPFDALGLLQDALGLADGAPREFESFEALYEAFRQVVAEKVESIYASSVQDIYHMYHSPCPVISFFTEGCVEKGKSYMDLGPTYTVRSPHIGGAPDAANALLAIRDIVYEQKRATLPELLAAVNANWEGAEPLRQYALNKIAYFGNDDAEADAMLTRVLEDFADAVQALNGRNDVLYPAGVSTFGRQIDWLPNRTASPHGKKKGDILSGNCSPTPGTDAHGATAVVKSYCRLPLTRMDCGAALDIKLDPSAANEDAIASLVEGFSKLGGFFMQIDVADAEMLRRAQAHPEEYKTLAVRVSGWSARFVTLCESWQNMIIERTAHKS